jgi:cation-transporting P-type ATPase 13A2
MISVALIFTTYMVILPAHWLSHLMQLTRISMSFKLFVIFLGLTYLLMAWVGEHFIFLRLARAFGNIKQALTKQSKKRKEYKIIQERMLF